MRVNIYTEEMPTKEALPMAEIVTASYISSRTNQPMTNYGLRIYLKSHPDLHFIPDRDDDRSAVTFWCGSKQQNIFDFIKMLNGCAEVSNLNLLRDKMKETTKEAETS